MPLSAVKKPSSSSNRVFSMMRSDESIVSQALQLPNSSGKANSRYLMLFFISSEVLLRSPPDQKRRLIESEKLFEKG